MKIIGAVDYGKVRLLVIDEDGCDRCYFDKRKSCNDVQPSCTDYPEDAAKFIRLTKKLVPIVVAAKLGIPS